MSKVSVIVPIYNAEKFLRETVGSILDQTYQDFEIIIINDGSTDKSEQIIRNFNDKRITYSYQENQGVSIARNNGIIKSRGEYIAFLDQDDLWLPEKLEKQVCLLNSSSEVGLVYSNCYIIDSQGKIIDKFFKRYKPPRGMVLQQLFLRNFIFCSTAVINRATLDKVELFNHDLSIVQDYDLWLRIAQFFNIEYIDIPLAKYRIHQTNMTGNLILGNQELIEVLDRFIKENPKIRSTLGNKVDSRICKSHYSLGRAYQFQKRFADAQKEFVSAVKYYPFYIKPYIGYLSSLLGISIPSRKNIVTTLLGYMWEGKNRRYQD